MYYYFVPVLLYPFPSPVWICRFRTPAYTFNQHGSHVHFLFLIMLFFFLTAPFSIHTREILRTYYSTVLRPIHRCSDQVQRGDILGSTLMPAFILGLRSKPIVSELARNPAHIFRLQYYSSKPVYLSACVFLSTLPSTTIAEFHHKTLWVCQLYCDRPSDQ